METEKLAPEEQWKAQELAKAEARLFEEPESKRIKTESAT